MIDNEEKNLSEIAEIKNIWLSLLGSSKELTDIPEHLKGDKAFQAYFEGSRMANFTKEQELQYTQEMITEWDINGLKKFERRVGFEDGFAEGEAKGIAEGEAKVARAMKEAGVPAGDIAHFTGLTEEQIEAL